MLCRLLSADPALSAAGLGSSALLSDDFAWQRGYTWYPDTPGAYPASKTDWYWNNGGLYDQAHVPGYTTTASYSARRGQANLFRGIFA